MPLIRLIGAKALTILTRANSSNFDLNDPCHGLIGFKINFLKKLNLRKLKIIIFLNKI